MKIKFMGLLGMTSLLFSCSLNIKPDLPTETIDVIAFGSCNKEYIEQPFWSEVAAVNPDLWIWLGDNIYADTDDMTLMAEKYRQQLSVPEYQKFRTQVPITGIWDDHDYGMNDGNRTFVKKNQAKDEFMSFMGVPENHKMSQHEGIYQSMQFGQPPQQIKLILLDTRTFQDPLIKQPEGREKNYESNSGTVLGETQWEWLNNELNQSTANINLIASSIQVIAEDHRYEMWANFPQQREKLLNLIVSSQVRNPLILSGDRHLSEISKLDWQGQVIYDITSSGLTHSFSGTSEDNAHRVGQLVTDESFSMMQIDWQKKVVKVIQHSTAGTVLNQHSIDLK